MDQLLEISAHTGWNLHDAYWLGACVFMAHFLLLSHSLLRRKNVIFSLVIMTAFWPLTYTFSIFQVMRMRWLKQQ